MHATSSHPRPNDWPERLAQYLAACERQPFRWGRHDCARFAAGAVKAVTGVDILGASGLRWRTRREAELLLAAGGGIAELAARALGEPVRGPAVAALPRGSVVCVVQADGRQVLGVLAGNGCWASPGPTGLVWRAAEEAVMGWRV